MKLIEELDLANLPDICRYLRGEMSHREERDFEERLEIDDELKDDYELIRDEVLKDAPEEIQQRNHFIPLQSSPKQRMASILTSKGFGIGLAVIGVLLAAIAVLAYFQ